MYVKTEYKCKYFNEHELHVTMYWQHPAPGAVTSHPLTFRLFVRKGVWLVIAPAETLNLTNYWKLASWMSWTKAH